jgi:peptidoglycan-associated lipoprotein
MDQDRAALSAYTVYFDFDRHAIKSSEQSKLEAVASFLKSNANTAVWIEGHCDERGTEAYNLSLGDRRAQTCREYLINLGIDARLVHVISYGEARPADQGHDEGAWSKNRRAEFVVLRPKQQ